MDRASVFGTDAANLQEAEKTETYGDSPDSLCHSLCHLDAELTPDLAEIVAAWATLPEPIKAGIVAMVKTACPTGGKRGE